MSDHCPAVTTQHNTHRSMYRNVVHTVRHLLCVDGTVVTLSRGSINPVNANIYIIIMLFIFNQQKTKRNSLKHLTDIHAAKRVLGLNYRRHGNCSNRRLKTKSKST